MDLNDVKIRGAVNNLAESRVAAGLIRLNNIQAFNSQPFEPEYG